jgi:hypothetical protein
MNLDITTYLLTSSPNCSLAFEHQEDVGVEHRGKATGHTLTAENSVPTKVDQYAILVHLNAFCHWLDQAPLAARVDPMTQ